MQLSKATKRNALVALLILVVGFVIDQFTKHIAAEYLASGKSVVLINNILDLSLVRNSGGAFGMGRDLHSFWYFLFLGVSLAAIIFIGYFLYRSLSGSLMVVTAVSLILSGALGNVIDRLRFRHVVDFIELHYKQYHWPNFNTADTLICIGVCLYLIHSFTSGSKKSNDAVQ